MSFFKKRATIKKEIVNCMPEYFTKIYNNEIDTKYCLYQTFYMIGIGHETLLSGEFYKNISEDIGKYYASLSPQILTKFPYIRHTYGNIPDVFIVKHCFPNGIPMIVNVNTIPAIKQAIAFSHPKINNQITFNNKEPWDSL